MDHSLRHQQLQQQRQHPQHYQQQSQAMAVHGTQQVGSPSMNANYMMQQNAGQYSIPQHQQQQQQYQANSQYAQHQQQAHVQQSITQQQMPQQQMSQHQMQQQYALRQQHSMPYPSGSYSRSFTAGAVASPPPVMGPRAKCDQVIHEALAKACEIAARGRCTDLVDEGVGGRNGGGRGYSDSVIGTAPRSKEKRRSLNYGNQQGASSGGSSSSRFNIEVDEVPLVRSTVQGWKGAPHTPLLLDIFYEHDACYDEQHADPNQPPPAPQRELLERWCIDYVASPSLSGNNSLNNSLSSSPSTTSPYSSRVMVGVHASEKPMIPSSNMSQLRQVCKRIVVLLRSLHCMARMLPGYRLRSLLLSNMAAGGGGVTVNNNGTITEMAAGGDARGVGWGTIGFSVHAGDPDAGEQALPSPSFARQSLPNVPTPYGSLNLSVMYDATLSPDHMVADLAVRRSDWMQRNWMAMGGAEQQQQLQYVSVDQQAQAVAMPSSTQPIPVADFQQQISISPGQPTVNSLPRTAQDRREYGSCPPTALIGSPATMGVVGRTRAVSDFIIKDYHNSPRLGPMKAPQENVANNNQGGGIGEGKRVMSGLSLAMMNEDHTSPVEAPPADPVINRRARSASLGSPGHQQEEEIVLTFGSPATRAAFHSPPPVYQEDAQQAAGSLGMADGNNNQQGTHFFQRHGGYGYGYNGANMLVPGPPVSTPPSDETVQTGRKSLAGSKSPVAAPVSPGTHRSGAALSPMQSSRYAPNSPLVRRGGATVTDSKGASGMRRSYRRTSSGSSALLLPVTSLDILQKSPFQAMRKTSAVSGKDGGVNQGEDILGPYREDTISTSIPWMVDRGSGSIGVSTLGGGSSNNPLMMPQMSSGIAKGSTYRESQREAEELPFPVEDDGSLAIGTSSSRSPSKSASRSLWGSTKADVLSGTLGATGGGGGGVADITSTLAVSSLAHRCSADAKVGLKMFEDANGADGTAVGADGGLSEPRTDSAAYGGGNNDRTRSEYASIADQLSDFKSFGASLMVENAQDDQNM